MRLDDLAGVRFGADSIDRPKFDVLVDGAPLPPEALASITGVSVDLRLNDASSFSLDIDDPKLRWIAREGGLLNEGAKIEIFAGYVGRMRSLIEGNISAVSANLSESGGLSLGVEGFDGLSEAGRGMMSFSYDASRPDSAIVADVASQLKLSASVTPTPATNRARIEENIKAVDFLRRIARDNGYVFWCEGNVLHFHPQRTSPTVVLRRRLNLISFDARLSIAAHVESVEVRGRDVAREEDICETASIDSLPAYRAALSAAGLGRINTGGKGSPKNVVFADASVRSANEALSLAASMVAEQCRGLITGSGAVVGNPDVLPGSLLQIDDMGRLSAVYAVESARHTVNENGYRTSFNFRLHV